MMVNKKMEHKDYIHKYLRETNEILDRIDITEINDFINILFDAWRAGKKVITFGNGGSSATASHFAGDLLKTVANDSSMKDISSNKGFKAICLNDNSAALTAWVNDSGWDKAYSGLLHTLLDEDDVVMLFSVHGASGWSGNMVEAMKLAKERGAKIIGMAGFDGGKMKEMCDACVVIPKDSTPHVEGLHGVMQHLVVFRVKEMIEEYGKNSGKMKLFADTASYNDIDLCFDNNVDDGITTNPKIMESTGDLSLGFEAACQALLEKYPNVPVSVETDLGGLKAKDLERQKDKVKEVMMDQALKLASLGKNAIIKIPVCTGGLMAVEELTKRGIKTNVTACMSPFQALAAAKAGATYVSYFANRALDSHIIDLAGEPLDIIRTGNWKAVANANREKYFNDAWARVLSQITYIAKELEENYPNTELIIGSIRSVEDMYRLAKAKPHIITIPTKIVKGFIEQGNFAEFKALPRTFEAVETIKGNSIIHPLTDYTLDEFEEAAIAYRNQ